MKKEYIECGRISSAHGVRGLVKVESWCDSPKVLATRERVYMLVGDEYVEHKVESASVYEYGAIMNIGIPSREDAQAMKGTVLYLKRCDIPVREGAVLIADMIGLPVIDVDTGHVYGTLSDVTDAARGKLYSVSTANGEVLIPDRPEFIKKIDTDTGIYIRPIPGFFD